MMKQTFTWLILIFMVLSSTAQDTSYELEKSAEIEDQSGADFHEFIETDFGYVLVQKQRDELYLTSFDKALKKINTNKVNIGKGEQKTYLKTLVSSDEYFYAIITRKNPVKKELNFYALKIFYDELRLEPSELLFTETAEFGSIWEQCGVLNDNGFYFFYRKPGPVRHERAFRYLAFNEDLSTKWDESFKLQDVKGLRHEKDKENKVFMESFTADKNGNGAFVVRMTKAKKTYDKKQEKLYYQIYTLTNNASDLGSYAVAPDYGRLFNYYLKWDGNVLYSAMNMLYDGPSKENPKKKDAFWGGLVSEIKPVEDKVTHSLARGDWNTKDFSFNNILVKEDKVLAIGELISLYVESMSTYKIGSMGTRRTSRSSYSYFITENIQILNFERNAVLEYLHTDQIPKAQISGNPFDINRLHSYRVIEKDDHLFFVYNEQYEDVRYASFGTFNKKSIGEKKSGTFVFLSKYGVEASTQALYSEEDSNSMTSIPKLGLITKDKNLLMISEGKSSYQLIKIDL